MAASGRNVVSQASEAKALAATHISVMAAGVNNAATRSYHGSGIGAKTS